MDWRAALRDRFVTDGPLSAMVGTRVYLGERPQGSALPAITVIVGDERPHTLSLWDYAWGRVQVDAYADDNKEAWEVGEAALEAIAAPASHQGHTFARADVAMGLRDASERAGGAPVFRVSADFIFYHAPA